jgi:hypothetical protein
VSPRKAPPKIGRPARAGKAATERIEIRVTKLERLDWQRAAELCGETLSEWIRRRCSVNSETVRILSAARSTVAAGEEPPDDM